MKFRDWALSAAWVIALVGTLLSLFYSAILMEEPCTLCWYQRIALFPLSVQLGIAAYHKDFPFAKYAYPLCVFGFLIAVYQSILPLMPVPKSCGTGGDCSEPMPLFLGIPFPWLSALGFVLIALFIRVGSTNRQISG